MFCSENCNAMLSQRSLASARHRCSGVGTESLTDSHAVAVRVVVERLLQFLELREIETPKTYPRQGHS